MPPVLLLAALAALAVGLARPSVSVSAERKQGTVVLALDRSGSMLAQDVDPDRITASREAAQRFVKNLPDGFRVGVVSFSDTADAVSAPSLDQRGRRSAPSPRIQAGGGTAIGDAIERSLGLLGVNVRRQASGDRQGPRDPAALRRLEHARASTSSDGRGRGQARGRARLHDRARHAATACSTCRRSARAPARSPCRPIPRRCKAIARETGGESFTALDESTLKKVYDHIGTRVSSTKEQKEVTFVVAGVAAAPAARGGGLVLGTAEHHMTFADPYLLVALVVVPAGRRARTSCSPAAAAAPSAPPPTRRCGPT